MFSLPLSLTFLGGKPVAVKRFQLGKISRGILGVILVLLAVGTVLSTAHANHEQRRLLACGSGVVQQTVLALKTRDAAEVRLTSATKLVAAARSDLYHALAEALEHQDVSTARISSAVDAYDKAAADYQSALDTNIAAINKAPLPTVGCLAGQD